MRFPVVISLAFTAASVLSAQTAPPAAPGLPKDPAAILAAAAPVYDFNDSTLAPWHLKATYQIYDEHGQPSAEGAYEYWWVSPQVHRSSWTRPQSSHTDWHTADGKYSFLTSGEHLQYFEYKLQHAFLSPLPDAAELDAATSRLERQEVSVGDGKKLPCVMVIPKGVMTGQRQMAMHGDLQSVPLGLFPTYCFDSNLPALRISYSFGTLTTEYDQIVRLKSGRYLPRQVQIFDGKRKILIAHVDAITGLDPADPALKPGPGSSEPQVVKSVNMAAGIAAGMILKKQVPVYPADAKAARISGTVVLRATIGTDGSIHDLHVVSAPSPSTAGSALWAVSHWEYKPFLLNGEPVEVETTINVIFSMGG
jgi:TonB family protein